MAHTFTNLLFHTIFSTKNREPLLNDDLKTRLFPYMGGIARNLNATLIEINGPSDHVHLLLVLPADVPIAETVRVLKTNSSKWIHETFPAKKSFAWQLGYSAFSVSRSSVPSVRAYIRKQVEHHQHVSFAEEIRAFLRKHGVKEREDVYLE